MRSNQKQLELAPPELSLVMPCYNEALGIETLLMEWLDVLRIEVESFELIVINDGSTDGTGRILDKIRRESGELRVFHQLNVGHGRAIRRGYEVARGRFVAQVDSNGCVDTSDFFRLWALRNQYSLVLGRRTHRIDSFLRRGSAYLSRRTIRLLFDVQLSDPDTPLRIMHADLLKQLLPIIPKTQHGLNLALSVLFKRMGANNVVEIPVPFRLRSLGKYHSSVVSTLSATGNVMGELINLKWTAIRHPLSNFHNN